MSDETPETTTDDAPKKSGRRKYTLTAAARAHERALTVLAKLTRSNAKVDRLNERIAKLTAERDEEIKKNPVDTEAVAAAQRDVDATRTELDTLVLGEASADE